jgi:hypothetical protein
MRRLALCRREVHDHRLTAVHRELGTGIV